MKVKNNGPYICFGSISKILRESGTTSDPQSHYSYKGEGPPWFIRVHQIYVVRFIYEPATAIRGVHQI